MTDYQKDRALRRRVGAGLCAGSDDTREPFGRRVRVDRSERHAERQAVRLALRLVVLTGYEPRLGLGASARI